MSARPYFEADGNLVIPFNAPVECRWWQAATDGRYAWSFPENMPGVACVEASFAAARELAEKGGRSQ